MNANGVIAAINASGSIAVAITALILAYRGLNSVERRLDVIQHDLKKFCKSHAEHDKRIQRLEDKQ